MYRDNARIFRKEEFHQEITSAYEVQFVNFTGCEINSFIDQSYAWAVVQRNVILDGKLLL